MSIIRNLKVPTGNILVVKGEKGPLEVLSLADYGKDVNLNQDKPVLDGTPLMPLTEKWVITMSTQYGCSMRCKFCDVPKVGPGINASVEDLYAQLRAARSLHPEITETKRLNIHFARMGEPTYNSHVIDFTLSCIEDFASEYKGRTEFFHPVISTMMPIYNKYLGSFLDDWLGIKNLLNGNAGLQLSINSTDDNERQHMFNGNSWNIEDISKIMKIHLYDHDMQLKGRKITLNFAVGPYTVDAKKLRELFDPKFFLCKLTPMHMTHTALENDIKTDGDYTTPHPYTKMAEELRAEGFDVLVFIASNDEDKGRVTCGNAILSGSLPHKYEEV